MTQQALRQLLRYGLVGVISNLVGYLLYLALTFAGMGPKLAMSLLYVVGVLQTFYFNRRWTFVHAERFDAAFVRYCSAYALGYFINLFVLMVLVDRAGYSHQWVQGFMIFVLAALLFLLQKFWVFRAASDRPDQSG